MQSHGVLKIQTFFLAVKLKQRKCSIGLTLVSIQLIFLSIVLPGSLAQSDPTADDPVEVQTAWSVDRVQPADTFALALVLKIKKGFHINSDARQLKPFADFKPVPTKVSVIEASEGLSIETARFPQAKPIKVTFASGDLMSFDGQTIIYLPMKLDENVEPGAIRLSVMLQYQACSDTYCLFPKKVVLNETIPVVKAGATRAKINKKLFKGLVSGAAAAATTAVDFNLFGWQFSFNTTSGFGWIMLLVTAAFGGMLLNLTPCVLPLIPIKIISLSHAAQDRKKCFFLGLTMSLGVLAFWMGLGILIAVVSDFTATNQLFQYPFFTILIGIIIGIMALGMFGFFSVRLPRFIYMIKPQQNSLGGSFGLGILAAVLATPCTAPFMGAAAAWAATQTPLTTLSAFGAIGGGMALPYLILSASPNLVNRMPKAGPVGVLIKQVMGLFMLAAAAYFLGVGIITLLSSPPNPPSKIYWWPVMGFVSAGGAWLAYRTMRLAARKTIKSGFVGLGVILIVLALWGAMRLSDDGPIDWIYYTPERFEAAIQQKKAVVMDFTAEWCLNCKALEASVLRHPKIIARLAKKDIVPIKVDITGNNPAGKAKLKEVGSLTVPLLVVFAPDGSPVFKSDFYSVLWRIQTKLNRWF
jgi:thiol:disulfide interchange protein DsbD